MSRSSPESGPWLFSVESVNAYKPVLEYCPNRALREKLWKNLVTIGSVKFATQGLSNKQAIEGIRYSRYVIISQALLV